MLYLLHLFRSVFAMEKKILDCDFKYFNRMKLPCRHSMAVALHIDRLELSTTNKGTYTTVFEFLLGEFCNLRWCSPYPLEKLDSIHTGPYEIDESMPFRFDTQEPFVKEITENIQTISYPTTIKNGGGRKAYSILSSNFKQLADYFQGATNYFHAVLKC